MRDSLRTGFSFGLTSGIITTLGLMVGLHSGTHSKMAVIGGILVIAVADAFSDAMGIHISEESEGKHSQKEIWQATLATFFSKLIFALTFAVPVLLFGLLTAVVVGIVWGLSLLSIFSYLIARKQKVNPRQVIAEHLVISFIVITIAHYLGDWAAITFK